MMKLNEAWELATKQTKEQNTLINRLVWYSLIWSVVIAWAVMTIVQNAE